MKQVCSPRPAPCALEERQALGAHMAIKTFVFCSCFCPFFNPPPTQQTWRTLSPRGMPPARKLPITPGRLLRLPRSTVASPAHRIVPLLLEGLQAQQPHIEPRSILDVFRCDIGKWTNCLGWEGPAPHAAISDAVVLRRWLRRIMAAYKFEMVRMCVCVPRRASVCACLRKCARARVCARRDPSRVATPSTRTRS